MNGNFFDVLNNIAECRPVNPLVYGGDITISCSDYRDTTPKVFYPIVKKGQCVNVFSDVMTTTEIDFCQMIIKAVNYGLCGYFKWNVFFLKSVLLFDDEIEQYSFDKLSNIKIHSERFNFDDIFFPGNQVLDFEYIENLIKTNNPSLVIFRRIDCSNFDSETIKVLSNQLEKLAKDYDITVIVFWSVDFEFERKDYEGVITYFSYNGINCYLHEIDVPDRFCLVLFEFGGVSPKYVIYKTNYGDWKLHQDQNICKKILCRNALYNIESVGILENCRRKKDLEMALSGIYGRSLKTIEKWYYLVKDNLIGISANGKKKCLNNCRFSVNLYNADFLNDDNGEAEIIT